MVPAGLGHAHGADGADARDAGRAQQAGQAVQLLGRGGNAGRLQVVALRGHHGHGVIQAVHAHHGNRAVQGRGRQRLQAVAVRHAPGRVHRAQQLLFVTRPFHGLLPAGHGGALLQLQRPARKAPLQVGQLGRQVVGKGTRRHGGTALHVEDMGRVAALLVVAHHVPGRQPRHGGRLERVQRLGAHHAEAQLVAMRQKARGHGQALAQRLQRLVAAVGEHGVGLGVERGGSTAIHAIGAIRPIHTTRAAPPHHGQAIGQRRVHLGQQPCEPAREQRLGAGQLANGGRLDQQAADQAPQGQRRHIAGPAVHQQVGPEGAHRAALGRGLEAVQHGRVGKVLGHEAPQLRGAKGLEEARQPQAHHVGVIAADHGQPGLGLAPIGIAAVQQAGNGTVDGVDDLGHGHGPEVAVGGTAHMGCQRMHLRAGQQGHGDFQPHATAFEGQHMPLHLVLAQTRQFGQVAGRDPLDVHAAAAFTNSSTASEQPLAAAPSARPSNRKPLFSPWPAHRPTSSVRMVVTAL